MPLNSNLLGFGCHRNRQGPGQTEIEVDIVAHHFGDYNNTSQNTQGSMASGSTVAASSLLLATGGGVHAVSHIQSEMIIRRV